MTTTAEAVDTCGAALGEPDGRRRAQLLDRCFAEDGVFASPPTGVVQGRDALNAALEHLHTLMPAPQVVRTTGIDAFDGRLRCRWQVIGEDGSVMFDQVDVTGELDEEGRISRMTVFMGPPPAKE